MRRGYKNSRLLFWYTYRCIFAPLEVLALRDLWEEGLIPATAHPRSMVESGLMKKGDQAGKRGSAGGPPRRRKPAEELTVAKRYTSIPASVVKEIRKASKTYGSQGRALQVATEILIRMRKRPLLPPESNSVVTKMTYKLVPR